MSENYEKYDEIATKTIQKDIDDTKKEMFEYGKYLAFMAANPRKNRSEMYLISGRIEARRVFVEKLKGILEYRQTR